MISASERLGPKQEGLKRAFDAFDFNLRVACPGIVVSFDAAKQTVVVQVAIKEKILIEGESRSVKIPRLFDVPICTPEAGGYALTFPIQAGDECLVVFSDTCFDSWYQSGGEENEPISIRRHDLSDAMAIMGIKSQPRVLSGYSTNSVQLRNDAGNHYAEISASALNLVFGATKVVVDDAGITCTGDVLMHDKLTVEGTTTIETRIFLEHQHLGVSKGGAKTDGVF